MLNIRVYGTFCVGNRVSDGSFCAVPVRAHGNICANPVKLCVGTSIAGLASLGSSAWITRQRPDMGLSAWHRVRFASGDGKFCATTRLGSVMHVHRGGLGRGHRQAA